MSRLTRWVHSRRDGAESGFAMMLSLFVMLIIVTVTLVVAALVTSQSKPTLLNQKFIRTVNGAQAGMQNTLSQLRAANDGLLAGDQIKLPCSDPDEDAKYGGGGVSIDVGSPATEITGLPGYPITGTVSTGGSANSVIGYSVSVVYFDADPTQYEDQNNPSWWKNNAVACPGGIVAGTPLYAFVQASGTGAQVPGLATTAGDRTLQGLYQFETTNSFSVGGRIAEYDASGAGQRTLCLDAGANPTVGTQPTMASCLALGTARQTWQYRTDLTIYYGGDTSLNLCITNMSGTPKLETCTSAANTPASPVYPYASGQQNQEWGFNDTGHLAAALSDGTVTNSSGGNCLEPNGATSSTQASVGALLVITSCDGSTTGYTAWNPDPEVGAGASLTYWTPGSSLAEPQGVPASSATSQFVNFAEFGRCLDVTGQDVNQDHLIDYPCKQAPSSCNLTWNQVWGFAPSTAYGKDSVTGNSYGEFFTDYASGRTACSATQGTNYCLTAPATAATHNYITVSPCGSTPTSYQLWDATGAQASYSSSYLLINKATGMCMAADPSIQPTYGSSTIVATACDGTGVPSGSSSKNSLLLKWNAPPDTPDYGLRNVQETGGQSG